MKNSARNLAKQQLKQSNNASLFLSIEQFKDLDQVCMADQSIVEMLLNRRDAGDKRLTFLVNRFEKDIFKLVKNVLTISAVQKKQCTSQPRQARIEEYMSKVEFRELWEHLKVCKKTKSESKFVMSKEQSLKEGGLNRMSKELIFVNDLWDLINLKSDVKTGRQAAKIEIEIVIEVLNTILNPLICLKQ